ncbi:putative GTPase-activator protein for Rho-like GTPases [Lyophyllum shimeji]|uniref:GTPase-activator protein for Rho-like GTPases n=1 Tax=Lyophyllum shimeji TaxID=47721 RepID=A0A9P3UL25_LYOSH|nr:putative GTPase-activator protein for Rho-like GTPases [Lyophyllum shimeji]
MSPGSEHSAASRLAGGPLWPSSSSGSRAPASSSNISHAQPVVDTSTIPRSSSLPLTAMGQTFGKSNTAAPAGPPPSPSTTQRGLTAAMAGGLRRAFIGRRKKSEDASKMMDRSISGDEATTSAKDYRQHRIQASASSSSSPAQLASQVVKVGSPNKSAKSPLQQQLPPPPPPPKPTSVPTPQSRTPPRPEPLKGTNDHRSSIIPMSPSISSAVNYMRKGEAGSGGRNSQEPETADNGVKAREEVKEEAKDKEKEAEQAADGDKGGAVDKGEMKESWRKSDSTIGHHTIRPGSRPSRPVSMAESLQSNYTIVPTSKRQSALITDADFGMPEEDDSDSSVEHNSKDAALSTDLARTPTTDSDTFPTADSRASPTSAAKVRNRRSMSLNIPTYGVPTKPQLPPTPSSASAATLTHSVSAYPAPPSMSPSHSRDAPPSLRTPANANGYIAPSVTGGSQSTGSDIHGRLAVWAAAPTQTRSTSSPTTTQQPPRSTPNNPYTTFPPPPEPLPSPKPMSRAERSLPALPPHAQGSPRQPTISMTSGLGLAKRAVEKMHIGLGRAWGIGSSSSTGHSHSNSTSGYSSSSSGHSYTNYTGSTPPSSYGAPKQHSHKQDSKHGHGHSSSASSGFNELVRTSSNHSQASGPNFLHKKHRLRHNPHATSVSSTASVSTSASASDSDALAQEVMGPTLGKRLRGPLRKGGGGGVVFGRDLKSVVRDTGVGVGKPRAWGGRWRNWDGGEEGEEGRGAAVDADAEGSEGVDRRTRKGSVRRGQLKALEERKLPALVVRCAQHLLIWGVQEEGLFRVSGRPSHVSKLRAEFDSGADFDMTGCSPGDLDPHAVASVFKAFLRELPEPILTKSLLPYFEAAMSQESTANASNDADSGNRPRSNSRGPGLPSDPRNANGLPALRSPPSLSTLAMPTFAGLRPPSKALLTAFRALLAQLPEENRDLIRTVAELIKATAKESRETKMPLSNLLLVFCPSLNMNPPLLRLLCEAEGIWEEPAAPQVVPAIEDRVLDIRRSAGAEDGEEFEDARDGTEDDGERESMQSESVGRTSEDVPSSVEYHASTEDVAHGAPRIEAEEDASSSMSRPSRQDAHARKTSLASSSLMDDESSFLSTSEDHENLSRSYLDAHSRSVSPPLLTSSAESLDTPSTSSHHASIARDDGFKQQGASSPVIVKPSPMGSSPGALRRPVISSPVLVSGPVQFPSTAFENQNPSPNKLEKRRSIPVLSLPNLSASQTSLLTGSDSPTMSLAARAKRLKKPSLHILFQKKSSSSLSSPRVASSPASIRPVISSPYLQAPPSASESSISTPLSAVTAPQSSTSTLPPKLDTAIDNSSLRIGVGLGIEVLETPATPPEEGEQTANASDGSQLLPKSAASVAQLPAASASVGSLIARGPSPTPIADRFHRAASPAPSLALKFDHRRHRPASHLRHNPTSRSRAFSASSNASSNHLGLLDDEESEDWTKSVLLAADVDGGWAIEQPAPQA